jgi:hypothetical protein
LKKEAGWEVGRDGLKGFIANEYKNLFLSHVGLRLEEVLSYVHSRVTPEMNIDLTRVYTEDEVWAALQAIRDLKAPSSDGVPSIFYNKFLPLLGDKVKAEVLVVLNGGQLPENWNETVIVLIPKVKNPEKLKDLRPISLCNVLYKLVSKVLANRLKNILPGIIAPSQSAFVPGKLITHNVVLAYELTHYMQNKQGGHLGVETFKLDMSKAYDRVEWPFLQGMMRRLGFAESSVKLIMMCVTTVSYKISVNGHYEERILPTRGLRQGDPLLPYLFILCAEGFSSLMENAEREGHIEGVKVCGPAPRISHMFFVDDFSFSSRPQHKVQKLYRISSIYMRMHPDKRSIRRKLWLCSARTQVNESKFRC